ncbi:MAG: hypothetical protein WCI76_01475 [bacterium]
MSLSIKCQKCKNDFLVEEGDLNFYKKMQVPAPTFCPRCRMFRRFMWRNEHFFFKKLEERTGNLIFSSYPPSSKVKIYEHAYWWSDAWDPKSYGVDYDFEVTFFEQFSDLLCKVPLCARSIETSINSDYSDHATNIKNAYLCFNGDDSENISFGFRFSGCKDCVDFYETKDSQLCFETFSIVDCERMFWSSNCANCYNLWFSDNCRNCNDCFGCVNLRNKRYCIFNKQHTKEEYEKQFKILYDGSFSGVEDILKKIKIFSTQFPVQYIHGNKNKDVTGDYIYASNNALESFVVHNIDNARFSQFVRHSKDIYDFTSWGLGCELIYESANCGENCTNLKFCFECWPSSHDLEYCVECHSSSYCFGCVGLKKGKYCIFNKQYSKEEYFLLRSKIIEHMNAVPYVTSEGLVYKYGEFFPSELSPFSYEDSSASDYFPNGNISKTLNEYAIEVKSSELSEKISDTDESIIGKVIECVDAQKCAHRCIGAFKITRMEFEFYKRFNLPLPRVCPNCRFYTRMQKLNPINTWDRVCMCENNNHNHENKCLVEFKTNYSPENPQIIYCEACYKKEMY